MRAIQEVIKLLNDNKDLKKIVKNISTNWHDEQCSYPQITVNQVSSTPFNWHDNKVNGRIVLLQLDIWSKDNPFIVAKKVINIMQDKGYTYHDERQLNEDKINRVMLIYKILEM